jgi:threonine/homoserine efflux transporter RhtA
VALAAAGVLLLTQGAARLASGPAGHLAGHSAAHSSAHSSGPVLGLSTEAAGIAFALLAATCWAAYILLSRATGRRFTGSAGLTIAMIVAAALVTAPAVAEAGRTLLHPGLIAEGLAIGLLSSVIPYRVELEALRRVPAGLFGIWMSMEPAVAALIGVLLLGENLIARQWLAIVLVIVACAGAARPPGRSREQPGEAADHGPGRDGLPPPPAA